MRFERHEYPDDLANAVLERWPEGLPRMAAAGLRAILSTCFQVSLLREEGRPLAVRILIGIPPESYDALETSKQVLRFRSARPFTVGEIRRLGPASDYYRTLLGVACLDDEPAIWGLVHTGPTWSRAVLGGRATPSGLPRQLIVHIRAPGELSVQFGDEPIASLQAGRVLLADFDVFQSRWLPQHFASVRSEILSLHRGERSEDRESQGRVGPDFIKSLAQNVVRRTLEAMRQARHGGTLIYVPSSPGSLDNLPLDLKYAFEDRPARRTFRRILMSTMDALARIGSEAAGEVGWREYSASNSAELEALNESAFELGHLFADLSSVDGALVLTRGFEILGFGAEIVGDLPQLREAWKARDLEGHTADPELIDTFGTRHRSVFRLCAHEPDLLAVVVSQDGQIRFVKQIDERVTYFDHRVLGAIQ